MTFFLIAHVEGSMMGTPEAEAEAYANKYIDKYIKEVGGNKNASANTGSGASQSVVGDTFEGIQMALKIVPNMD